MTLEVHNTCRHSDQYNYSCGDCQKQALTLYKQELMKKLEEEAFIPELDINQQWTGKPVKHITLTRAIELIREE